MTAGGAQGRGPGVVARALLLVIGAYRAWISPLLGPRCRFAPSCSAYAAESLRLHGAGRGGWYAVRRLARCHPFHPGGHDPVPPARPWVTMDVDSPSRTPDRSRASARPDAPEQTRA